MFDVATYGKCGKASRPGSRPSSPREHSTRKYTCEYPQCRQKNPPARFRFKCHLIRHQRTHTGSEKKRRCQYCQENLDAREDNYRRHVKTQHRGGILDALDDGNEETVVWLLDNYPGCGNTYTESWGHYEAPLIYAVKQGLNMVRIMLADERVDVNQKGGYGGTALQEVVMDGDRKPFTKERLEILKLLLDKKADRRALNWGRKTAFDFALEKQARDKEPNPFLLEAIELLRPETEGQQEPGAPLISN
ncbi:hypothetical protein V8F20_001211 [Naviculisporaceae sp. PSN 640]